MATWVLLSQITILGINGAEVLQAGELIQDTVTPLGPILAAGGVLVAYTTNTLSAIIANRMARYDAAGQSGGIPGVSDFNPLSIYQLPPQVSEVASFTAALGNAYNILGTANVTVTLPAASSAAAGTRLWLSNITPYPYVVTVNPAGSDTIANALTTTMTLNDVRSYCTDGVSKWYPFGAFPKSHSKAY